MNHLSRIFIYVRWPVTLGLLGALIILTAFPRKLEHWDLTPSNTTTPRPAEHDWQGPISYSDAVSKASMGVVNIYTRKEIQQRLHPFFNDPVFRQLFNSADVPRQKRMQSALGSGVIVTSEGHILTNHHVISGADEIVVALEDGRNAHAKVLGENIKRDLAVLKIELDGLQALEISPKPIRVGDVVLAIGNPFGVGQTVTQGIISATRDRNLNLNISDFEDFIQTDAAIHPGSSGGALIDAYGNLIGINTANLTQSGSIGFAVPMDIAMQTLNDILQFGRVVRGWLGVEAQQINPQSAQRVGLPTTTGMIITRTTEGGPAANAGLLPGDVIVGISGNPIRDANDIMQTIQESRPGETLTIDFIRNGKAVSLDVIIEEQPLAAS